MNTKRRFDLGRVAEGLLDLRGRSRALFLGAAAMLVASSARAQSSAQSADASMASAESRVDRTDGVTAPPELSTADWASIRAAYEAGRHAAFAVDGGHRARNPGQQWTTFFDGRGSTTTPDVGDWTWGLELVRWGRHDAHRIDAASATVTTSEQRVSYAWGDQLTEWFVNDARGLEHGYTVHERPAGDAREFSFALAVRGGLVPEVVENGRTIRFLDGEGSAVLTYSGLTVFDAHGDELPAHFQRGDAGVDLIVDDTGAAYPLTIDPVAQQAYLKASNTGTSDLFGWSVAISGDTAVVGARRESSNATVVNGNQSNNSAANAGAAYVFVRNGTTWTQQAYLKASNAGAGDEFGWSVAISGDTVVVGARSEDSTSAGVNGNGADNSGFNNGAAYVFVRSGTTWTQQAYLKASIPANADNFGESIAVSGDCVVVGAPGESSIATGINGNEADATAPSAGAAYVFVRNGTTWTQQAYLKASNTQAFDDFGFSVAVSGETVVVGAYLEDGVNDGFPSSGAAYVFVRNGTTWSQQAFLKGSNTGAGDGFGISVSVSGETLVVGAWNENGSATGVNGNQTNAGALKAGAAYVFVRSGTNWTQQAYLKASNTAASDEFGYSVSVSGNLAIVGAWQEDSASTGVNGDGTDNSAVGAGAAYVFARSGTTWTQQAYVKASNPDADDQFGISVSMSGDTAIVGAWQEDSGSTGVNGSQTNTSSNSGAAYVFDLDQLPDPWTVVGSGVAGTTGVPVLVGSGTLVGGEPLSLALSNAKPGGSAALIIGLSALNAPFMGGTLVPTPNTVVAGLPIDGTGALVIGTTMPVGIPSGAQFWVQYWIVDPAGPAGVSASNGLRGTTP
jgi:hypothetical protein